MNDHEGSGSVSIAILAAGGSRRLGFPKQLVAFRGRPLLATAVEAACGTHARVAVVLGALAQELPPCLAGYDVEVLFNRCWAEGVATSVHCAVAWAMRRRASGLLLALSDQPHLDTRHLDRLIAKHVVGGGPVASVYSDVRGVPAIIPHALFPALLALRGDRGASAILRGRSDVTEVSWPAGAVDIDVLSDVSCLGAG